MLGLRNAALQGPRVALLGIAARFLAFAVLAALAIGGLGAVLTRSAVAFELLRWLGVAYLAYLGVSALFRAWRGGSATTHAPPARDLEPTSARMAMREEALVALTNPKALLLFAAFVPQFAPVGSGPPTLGLLAASYVAVELVSALGYVALGAIVSRIGTSVAARRRRLDAATGVGFLGFAGYLALARRP